MQSNADIKMAILCYLAHCLHIILYFNMLQLYFYFIFHCTVLSPMMKFDARPSNSLLTEIIQAWHLTLFLSISPEWITM